MTNQKQIVLLITELSAATKAMNEMAALQEKQIERIMAIEDRIRLIEKEMATGKEGVE